MQVLDNFLDNDEGNHSRMQNQQQQQQQQQQQPLNRAHGREHEHHTYSSAQHPASQTAIETAAAAAAVAGHADVRSDAPPPLPGVATASIPSSALSINEDNLDATDLGEDVKTQIRSERKRTREKQRRSDVNAQFSALTELLKRVEGYDLDSDVSDDEEGNDSKKQKLSPVPVINATPSNRVDLIARTIAIMDRLHKVNRSLRQTVKGLRKSMKKISGFSSGGDDLKKPGMMNSNGIPFGQNGQMPGMMMMMPQGMQHMGMMGGGAGGGATQQGDQQVCHFSFVGSATRLANARI